MMKTSHEVQVEIREAILPIVRDLNERISALYRESVSPLLGQQGLHGPDSDISHAHQLLDGSRNLIASIADYFGLPVAYRGNLFGVGQRPDSAEPGRGYPE